MEFPCVVCSSDVRPRQEALQCDLCSNWQHRICNTGISRATYRQLVKGLASLDWQCVRCADVDDEPDDSTEDAPYNVDTDIDDPMQTDDTAESDTSMAAERDYTDDSTEDDPYNVDTDDPIQTDDTAESDTSMTVERSYPMDDLMDQSIAFGDRSIRVPVLESTRHSTDAGYVNIIRTLESFAEDTDNDNVGDESFDLSHRRVDDITEPDEMSINDNSEVDDTVLDDQPIEFEILEKGSKRGGRLLVSSDGFSYGVKRENKSSTLWTCSVRSNKMRCHATVRQSNDMFVRGPQNHIHPADHKLPLRKKVSAQAKSIAKQQIFVPALNIIEDVVSQSVQEHERFLVPKFSNIKRYTNNYRAKFRPTDLYDLDFDIDMNYLRCTDFLVADVKEDGQRHIIFATAYQLDLLEHAKRWFIDGTFKIVPSFMKPSGQLMSIHAFVKKDGQYKQFPLVLILMSRRRLIDYIHVFRALSARVDNLAVEMIVADFEAAAWQAVREVFPTCELKGCVFHWTKAVWSHIQTLGLATTYRKRESAHSFMKQLMALPFLPAAHIRQAFTTLSERTTPQLQDLVDYISNQWMNNPVFPIRTWSVYRYTVRTNNDVEGWHHRLNKRAMGRPLRFYELVPLLRQEAEMVNVRIVSADLERNVRQTTTRIMSKLSEAWDKYISEEISTSQFLKLCGSM